MILKNCRLIPELSDGVSFELADVEIQDGKILHVRPASGLPCRGDDMDCGGMTLLPGLIDLHVHIGPESKHPSVYNAFSLYHKYAPMMAAYLDMGITTIRDCGSTLRIACYLRDGIEQGLFAGPRIQAAGYILSPESLRNSGENGCHFTVNGADEMLKAARREFANGADFIKLYATESMHQVRGKDPRCILMPEEIQTAVRVAEENNSYVAAHAHTVDAIHSCIRNGVRSIEHATYIDDEAVRLLKAHKDAYAVFTHACSEPYHEGDGWNDPKERAFWKQPYVIESCKRCRALENKAYQAGIRIGLGTDLMVEEVVKYPYEFMIRKESCGMRDLDILIQATKLNAETAMLEGVGEVREGYAADLIAVQGKPDQDISAMYKRPAMVMMGGKVHKKP